MRRLLLPLVLIGIALLIVSLLAGLALRPASPLTLTDSDGTYNATITLTPSRLFRPQSGCFTLGWQLDGIQTVQLNGRDTVGENTQELCGGLPSVMRFVVTLPDGQLRWYDVPIAYTTQTVGYGALTVLAVLFGISGVYLLFDRILSALIPTRSNTPTTSRFSLWPLGLVFHGGVVFGLPIYGTVVYGLSLVRVVPVGWLPPLLVISITLGTVIGWWNRPQRVAGWSGLLLPLVLFAPAFFNMFNNIAAQFGTDGTNHTAFLYSILHNGLPPENVWFAGEPANFYWLFHGLFIVPMSAFGVHAGLSALIVQTVILIAILYWAGRLVLALGLTDTWQHSLGMWVTVILFSGNLFGLGYHVANVLVKGGSFWNMFALIDGHVNTGHLSINIYRFTGFQIGILFALVVLVGIVGLYKRGLTIQDGLLVVFGVTGAVAYHATSALFLIVNLPLAFLLTWGLMQLRVMPSVTTIRTQWITLWSWLRTYPLRVALTFIGFAAIALPIAHYLLAVGSSNASGFGWIASFENGLLLILPMLPFVGIGLWQAKQETNTLAAYRFFFALGFVGVVNGALMNLSGQGDKFIGLGVLALGVVVAYGIQALIQNPHWAMVGRLAVFMVLAVTVDAVALQHLNPNQPKPFVAAGQSLLEPEKADNDLCVWVRDNTPTDAVIIYERTSVWNSSVYLCERSIFMGQDYVITEPIADYYLRELLVKTVFENTDPPQNRLDALQSIVGYPAIAGRPVYLQMAGAPLETLQPHLTDFEIAYQDDIYTLYRIR